MKKIINNSCWILLLLISSCGNKQKKVDENTVVVPVINQIVGVGKVLPKDGIITLTANDARKVVALYKKLGDHVQAGDPIFSMEQVSDALNIKQAQAAEQTAKAELNAAALDIQKEKIKLVALKNQWETSKQLYLKQAETRENTLQDSINYASQLVIVQQQEKMVQAKRIAIQEKSITTATQKANAADHIYKAPQSGTLIRLDVSLGAMLSAASSFGELAPDGPLVVEAELDEYYAQQIQIGKQVDIVLIGQTEVIAKGTVSFVNNALQNKSILYEQVGEGQDRRVRRFTVSITGDASKLLINQKVECKIHL